MDIKKLYESGKSSIQIAKELELPIHKVIYELKKSKTKMRSNRENSREYTCNESFFSCIQSESQAYWLGFLFADGYVTKRNYVGCALHSKDKAHLQKLKEAIAATYPLKDYKGKSAYGPTDYTRLLISSTKMKLDLVALGCIEHKSLCLNFPIIDSNLIYHFIRGYFDGDGSWAIDKKTNGFSFKVCGTREFLTKMCEALQLETKLYQRKKSDKNNYYISVSGKRVKTVMECLYKDATIYLDRKYERYLLSLQSEKTES